MSQIRSFEDLECFKFCKELRLEVTNLVKTFPISEQYRLTDQMIRCSRSITNNIAEGYGRFHFKENIQFCRVSRGSLYELLDHLQIALENQYIDITKLSILESKIVTCLKLMNGYINYLNSKVNSNYATEPEPEYNIQEINNQNS
jgi:four helix bundle protein